MNYRRCENEVEVVSKMPMADKESRTKNFVLRIDADTLAAIEKWAADEFRSTNGQLQWIIAEALKKHGRAKKTKTKSEDL